MSENRCRRCNRPLADSSASYGWRCAQIMGMSNSKQVNEGTWNDILHATHSAADELNKMGIDWKNEENIKLYLQLVNKYLSDNPDVWRPGEIGMESIMKGIAAAINQKEALSMHDAPAMTSDGRGSRTAPSLTPSSTPTPHKSVVQLLYEQFDRTGEPMPSYFIALDVCSIPEAMKNEIMNLFYSIDLGAIKDWDALSTVEQLTRIMFAEQRYEGYYENQAEIYWVFFNRMFDDRTFRAGDGGRTMRGHLNHKTEYTTLGSTVIMQQMSINESMWVNAMLVASYMYAAIGDRTKDEIIKDFRIISANENATVQDAYDYYAGLIWDLPTYDGQKLGDCYREEVQHFGTKEKGERTNKFKNPLQINK